MKYKAKSWIGFRSGFLTVIGYEKGRFICKCACGREVCTDTWMVAQHKKLSCSHKDCPFHKHLRSHKTHGLTGTRLYTIWNGMIGRCYRTKNPNYSEYGGRGIIICDEWKNNIFAFVTWAEQNGYSDDLTLDRIDVNGNYEPSNCRWVGYDIQIKNRRPYSRPKRKATKHIWTINGVTKSGVEWCKEYKVSVPTVLYRINKLGVNPEEALTMGKIQTGRPRKEKSDARTSL